MSLAISFYNVVVAVHVMAVVVAFGVTFAYPFIEAQVKRTAPGSLPAWHGIVATVNGKFVTPAMGVALIAGIYAALDASLFDKVWVQVPIVILLVLFGIVGGFLTPQSRKLAELAAQDVAAAGGGGGGGTVTRSAEYEAVSKRVGMVGGLAGVLILLAIFFMEAKPGGY